MLKLLKTAEGIRKLLETVAEALAQVSGKSLNFNMHETATLPQIRHFAIDYILRVLVSFHSSIRK